MHVENRITPRRNEDSIWGIVNVSIYEYSVSFSSQTWRVTDAYRVKWRPMLMVSTCSRWTAQARDPVLEAAECPNSGPPAIS